jgi:glycosyltransferase involved in cell wall biosynthesis
MLNRLIDSLQKQESKGLFTFSITVVDNDNLGSGRALVASIQKSSAIPIHYNIEPVQNISLARNRALTSTEADYYACIDDDEFADELWLFNLYETIRTSQADGVLGPVRPFYEASPPSWLLSGKILGREEFPTGTRIMNAKHTRSGNVIISKKIVHDNKFLFNPEYGRTGGEDYDFFKRMIDRNYRFIWCNEALVYENTPRSRLTRSYYLRRAFLRGVVHSKNAPLLSSDTLKSLIASMSYTVILPLVFIFRNRSLMPIMIKDCDHLGKILARFGINVVKQRSD